jgi:hypothetical protein
MDEETQEHIDHLAVLINRLYMARVSLAKECGKNMVAMRREYVQKIERDVWAQMDYMRGHGVVIPEHLEYGKLEKEKSYRDFIRELNNC